MRRENEPPSLETLIGKAEKITTSLNRLPSIAEKLGTDEGPSFLNPRQAKPDNLMTCLTRLAESRRRITEVTPLMLEEHLKSLVPQVEKELDGIRIQVQTIRKYLKPAEQSLAEKYLRGLTSRWQPISEQANKPRVQDVDEEILDTPQIILAAVAAVPQAPVEDIVGAEDGAAKPGKTPFGTKETVMLPNGQEVTCASWQKKLIETLLGSADSKSISRDELIRTVYADKIAEGLTMEVLNVRLGNLLAVTRAVLADAGYKIINTTAPHSPRGTRGSYLIAEQQTSFIAEPQEISTGEPDLTEQMASTILTRREEIRQQVEQGNLGPQHLEQLDREIADLGLAAKLAAPITLFGQEVIIAQPQSKEVIEKLRYATAEQPVSMDELIALLYQQHIAEGLSARNAAHRIGAIISRLRTIFKPYGIKIINISPLFNNKFKAAYYLSFDPTLKDQAATESVQRAVLDTPVSAPATTEIREVPYNPAAEPEEEKAAKRLPEETAVLDFMTGWTSRHETTRARFTFEQLQLAFHSPKPRIQTLPNGQKQLIVFSVSEIKQFFHSALEKFIKEAVDSRLSTNWGETEKNMWDNLQTCLRKFGNINNFKRWVGIRIRATEKVYINSLPEEERKKGSPLFIPL